MTSPSRTHQQRANQPSSSLNGANAISVSDGAGFGLMHNPGIILEWTHDEQMILEKGLSEHMAESKVNSFAKIAAQLPNKTIRDVALRYSWMTRKENGKRRKEELDATRKSKERKMLAQERVFDHSLQVGPFAAQPNAPPHVLPVIPMSFSWNEGVDGATRELLEQNAKALNQISMNLASLELQENTNLFYQIRDNIFRVMDGITYNNPGVIRKMPPLPVKLKELPMASFPIHTTLSDQDRALDPNRTMK